MRTKNIFLGSASQRLPAKMEAGVDSLCLLAQPREGQQFKNKKQPELTQNQTVWKSDNQGDKDETFIQTGRSGGDRQPGQTGLMARRRLVEQVVPHSSADKPGGTTGE